MVLLKRIHKKHQFSPEESCVDKSSWLHWLRRGPPTAKAFCKGRLSIKCMSGQLHWWFHLSYGWPRRNPCNQAGKSPAGLRQSTLPYWLLDQILHTALKLETRLANQAVRYCCCLPKPELSDCLGLCSNTNYCWVAQRRVNYGSNCKSWCLRGEISGCFSLKKPFKVGLLTSQEEDGKIKHKKADSTNWHQSYKQS